MKLLRNIFLNGFGCVLFIAVIIAFVSCSEEKKALFPVYGTEAVLLAKGRTAQEGKLDFSRRNILKYRFDDSFAAPPNSSLEIEYYFNTIPSAEINGITSLVLNMGSVSWLLPMDVDAIRYSIPVQDSFDGHFYIAAETDGKTEKEEAPVFYIKELRFTDRWFGFDVNNEENISYTPFVYWHENGNPEIDVPPAFRINLRYAEVQAVFSAGQPGVLEFADNRIESFPGNNILYVPSALCLTEGQAKITAGNADSFILRFSAPVSFPKPVKADPFLVIEWPKENWRSKNYEVFAWDIFEDRSGRLLIFDFADYAMQDRMLKRLAFFAEKAGFSGRLAGDHEIADLHGWNAHDYRSEDLARFFDTARRTNFPLLDEERELEKILLNENIIREEQGAIAAGNGAIISISRESPDYLRYRFMAHEGFHGLYFIDKDFREFSRQRWMQLPAAAKRFITSYFEFQQYDTKDEYLLINEFMAHILQQSVLQAEDYFGKQLPQRLESSWRASALPQKDASSGTWPALADVFTEEAQAFSDYVNRRWGLSAGRVWRLRIK